MKVHRFYVGGLHDKRGQLELGQHIWVHDEHLLNQWLKVLRLREGEQVELFDDQIKTVLYKIDKIEDGSVGLAHITEVKPKIPSKHIYLFWSLLKNDNNDMILQKCTELGVKNFVPIISKRTEKNNLDDARARRIVIEAAEQCGRSDIPKIREPITLIEAIDEYNDKIDLYISDMSGEEKVQSSKDQIGIMVGPEGGWEEDEMKLFNDKNLKKLNLHDLTLRAETAAITAITRLIQ